MSVVCFLFNSLVAKSFSLLVYLLQIFTVQLTLGEQVWEAEGTSIKKAQHSTAAKALAESVLPRPAPRSPKVDINSNPGTPVMSELPQTANKVWRLKKKGVIV